MCNVELGYPEEVCDNLDADENAEYENEGEQSGKEQFLITCT